MFYFRFVNWLITKVNRWITKRTWGDVGLYNHFDDMRSLGWQPLGQLFALFVVIIFYGLPVYAVMRGIWALPISPNAQFIVLVSFFFITFCITAVVLIRAARPKKK